MLRNDKLKKVAKNFAKKYGKEKLDWMIRAFQAGYTLEQVAQELGVSTQRVHQWKEMFGAMEESYYPDTSIVSLLKENEK